MSLPAPAIALEHDVITPGDTLTGHVRVPCDAHGRVSDVDVSLVRRAIRAGGGEHVVRVRLVNDGAPAPDGALHLSFSLAVPVDALPSTATVAWLAVVEVGAAYGSDARAEAAVTVRLPDGTRPIIRAATVTRRRLSTAGATGVVVPAWDDPESAHHSLEMSDRWWRRTLPGLALGVAGGGAAAAMTDNFIGFALFGVTAAAGLALAVSPVLARVERAVALRKVGGLSLQHEQQGDHLCCRLRIGEPGRIRSATVMLAIMEGAVLVHCGAVELSRASPAETFAEARLPLPTTLPFSGHGVSWLLGVAVTADGTSGLRQSYELTVQPSVL